MNPHDITNVMFVFPSVSLTPYGRLTCCKPKVAYLLYNSKSQSTQKNTEKHKKTQKNTKKQKKTHTISAAMMV